MVSIRQDVYPDFLPDFRNLGVVARMLVGVNLIAIAAAALGAESPARAAERFIQPIQYLILPISGFLFMADWLPDSVRKLALYFPMLHCFEITRDGFFGETIPTHYSAAYPFLVGVVLLAIFLPRFEKVRDVIHYG